MGLDQFQTRIGSVTGSSLLVRINNQRDYHLDDLGSGVAQLLILLGTVALKQPSFLFIDEPELNLHPSLQLDLLSTLAGYVKGNIVFSTHNIGLARAAATRIYSVQQNGQGLSSIHSLEETPTLAQFLGELQYGAYSQIGGNRVLLVEGKHDVLVFQQFLRKFGKDHEVVILPLGGKTLINADSATHLDEVKRICNNVAVIIDSERSSADAEIEKPRQVFLRNCRDAGFHTHITDRRATDHYFTERAIHAAFNEQATALQPFDPLNVDKGWTKATSWLAAQEMTKEELLATDVGLFLQRWLS